MNSSSVNPINMNSNDIYVDDMKNANTYTGNLDSSKNTADKIVKLSPETIKYDSVERAIDDIKAGKFVLIADDEGRENEGSLICAASLITPQMVNFMDKEAGGMMVVGISANQAEKLGLPQMVQEHTDPSQPAFTVSIDAGPEFGVTSGVSAADRAITIQRMTASNATAQDFRRPGHVFPVQIKNGGVLRRVGDHEAAVDMARLAGLPAMGVACHILNEDGAVARRDDLAAFAKKHQLRFITIAQIIQHRLQSERDVVRRVTREIDTKFGRFTAIGYRDINDGAEHLALIKGDLATLGQDAPYIRVQHENIITDVLGRSSEDVPQDIAQALSFIEAQGKGAVIYLRQRDDSAHGLIGSLKAYQHGTPSGAYQAGSADLRDYGVGAQILLDLGVKNFRMLGRSTRKIVALRGYGLNIVDNMPLATPDNFIFETIEEDAVPAFVPAAAHNTELSSVIAQHNAVTAMIDALSASTIPAQETSVEPENIVEQVSEALVVAPSVAASEAVAAPEAVSAHGASELNAVANVPELVAAAPVAEPVAVESLAQNENKKVNGAHYVPENTFSNQHPVTMKMGGQIISNQALFEG